MSTAIRAILLGCLLGLILLPLSGVARADAYYEEMAAARATFFQAVDGDKRAVRSAMQQFRKLKNIYPDNPVIGAYIGACESLQGRDGSNVTAKKTHTEAAIRAVEAALAGLPPAKDGNADLILETKLVAANTFLNIPTFFQRRDQGEALIRDVLSDPRFAHMPAGFRAAVMMSAATVAQNSGLEGEYTELLKRAAETDPQGRDGRRAAQLLAGGAE